MLTGIQSAALSVQRTGLSMLLGCLAKPNSRATERTIYEVYHLRLPERDASQTSLGFPLAVHLVVAV